MPGDNANNREKLPRLDWQHELDSTMTDIDDRLTHPRRRSTDVGPRPNLTPEMMDEIAWRVADQLRKHGLEVPPRRAQPAAAAPPAVESAPTPPPAPVDAAPAPRPPVRRPPLPPKKEDEGLRAGKMVMIRYRMPSLPWPFRLLLRRRKQHPLTTAKVRV